MVADQLKEGYDKVKAPKEAIFWKTGWFKEYPPENHEDFWYIRAASLLRKLYRKPIGVNRLKKIYGGRTEGNAGKNHTSTGSGAIIRRILQQLEKAKLVKIAGTSGRTLTNEGKSLLDKTAAAIRKEQGKRASYV